jgi:hypothetical protein
MKQHLAAIAYNQRELEAYVSQLKTQRFEAVSEVKKAEDGTYYQILVKAVRAEMGAPQPKIAATELAETVIA